MLTFPRYGPMMLTSSQTLADRRTRPRSFEIEWHVLPSTKSLQTAEHQKLSCKILPRFIGPFTVLKAVGPMSLSFHQLLKMQVSQVWPCQQGGVG